VNILLGTEATELHSLFLLAEKHEDTVAKIYEP
jgi:hypothetical protein